jgi:hypothetical protein
MWPILALAAEGTALNRYRGTAARELLAVGFCCAAYLLLWVALDRILEAATGVLAGIVAATVLSLAAIPLLLYLGFRIFGVKPGSSGEAH